MTEDCQEFSTVPFANVRWRHLLTRECSLLIAASLTQAWVQEIEVSAGTVTCKKKHQLCADSAYPTQCKIDLPYLSGAFCCWQLARGQLDRQERRRLFGRHQSPISIAKTRKGSAAPFALAALRPCRRRRLRNPNQSGYGNVRACVHTCERACIRARACADRMAPRYGLLDLYGQCKRKQIVPLCQQGKVLHIGLFHTRTQLLVHNHV
jgi:hypothetical protein